LTVSGATVRYDRPSACAARAIAGVKVAIEIERVLYLTNWLVIVPVGVDTARIDSKECEASRLRGRSNCESALTSATDLPANVKARNGSLQRYLRVSRIPNTSATSRFDASFEGFFIPYAKLPFDIKYRLLKSFKSL
jgi:hypothetical protein